MCPHGPTERKHPGIDHPAQVERLRRDTAAAGGRPVWLLGVLDRATEDEIAAWARDLHAGAAHPVAGGPTPAAGTLTPCSASPS